MDARNALEELLALAYPQAAILPPVALSGADPVFPTPFLVGTAGGAALAAVGVAVADLWRMRTGRLQTVTINLRAAAAAMRSARYLRIDGKAPELWDPLSGFYPVKDGRWINLHCNFPAHRAAAARVLGALPERAAMEGATRGWVLSHLHCTERTICQPSPRLVSARHRDGGYGKLPRPNARNRRQPAHPYTLFRRYRDT